MAVTTYEGVVEKGKIRLKSDVKLPENIKVYVVVPELQVEKKIGSCFNAAPSSTQASLRF